MRNHPFRRRHRRFGHRLAPCLGRVIPGLLAGALGLSALATTTSGLRPVSDFQSIADKSERSAAFFVEAGKVIQHPRCLNCHPASDQPRQGDSRQVHEPPVRRGAGGHGVVGMRCSTCHHAANFDPGAVPGAPSWHLAPLDMAWEEKTLTEICEQIKDKSRNGDRSLREIVKHMAEDPLVAWAWEPGTGRESAPGTQAGFAKLIRAWVESGAVCPK